ncbi:hypothetical protein Tcan_15800 [Toxocara canis]|uniref:7TM GPCR serpentine receptor class x (Srx) domain-containing protein n=1 Tax=Toxocara canis TaxID=6265 RepID=A0A0B2V9C9_TOXCA|nr:hypothetical protein Tcan_15800 [Toxocara canis]
MNKIKGLFFSPLAYKIFGGIFGILWFTTSLLKASMAINRFLVICTKTNHTSNKLTALFSVLPWLFGAVLYFISTSLPCCRFIISYKNFGVVVARPPNAPNATNYANIFVQLPTNTLVSLTIIFCYGCIIFTVQRLRRKSVLNKPSANGFNKIADFRCAMQFLIIALTYMLTWISLRIIPKLSKYPPVLALQTLLAIINFSTTGAKEGVRNAAFTISKACEQNDRDAIKSTQV